MIKTNLLEPAEAACEALELEAEAEVALLSSRPKLQIHRRLAAEPAIWVAVAEEELVERSQEKGRAESQ